MFFVGAGYGTLKLISLKIEDSDLKYNIISKPDGSNPFKAHTADVYSVAFAFDIPAVEKDPKAKGALYAISASHDKRVLVWSFKGSPCLFPKACRCPLDE